MPRFRSQARVFPLLAAVALAACGGVSATTRMYPDAPTFAPTDASAVEVLRNEPAIPYIRLGEITLSLKGNPSQDALSKALQKQGAEMGATAVLLVFDGSNSMGVMYSGPLWTPPPPDPMMADQPVLVGVALRYK
jgi:hypothetical protein